MSVEAVVVRLEVAGLDDCVVVDSDGLEDWPVVVDGLVVVD
jgi:hypothetical protein